MNVHPRSTPSCHPVRRTPSAAFARRLAPALLAAACSASLAQQSPRNLLALGVISVPEFEGAADASAAPLLLGRLDLGRYGSLRLAGAGLQYNVLEDQGSWALGPVLSFRAARDADVEDEVVRRLREVDSAAEFGIFVEYGLRDLFGQGDRMALGLEAKGGKGSQLALTASYLAARQVGFQWGMDVRTVFANDEYMDRYFSVDADNSTRSGLAPYTAGSGIKNFGFGLTASYDLAPQWTVIGRVGVTRLLGDARDSPIVQLRGDATATSVGLAVGYRF